MTSLLVAMLLLQSLSLPPRAELERPALLPPARAAKDYDKVWTAFVAGTNDAKTLQEADKLLKKEKTLDQAITTIKAYIDLYRRDSAGAERQFEAILSSAPQDRIALRFLGDLAFARDDYARAGVMYSRLLESDPSLSPEIEPKRQKSLLMTAERLFRLAAAAEKEGRTADAERLYRDAGGRPMAASPAEPAAPLTPAPGIDIAKAVEAGEANRKMDELEDLGRWGADIQRFRKMQTSSALSREEFAVLVMRYFPELVEFRQNAKPAVDIQDSWAAAEIQTLLGLGIADLPADQAFHPTEPLTRGDLCRSLASLAHIVGVFAWEVRPNTLPDVASDDPLLRDVQWALGSGLLVADKSGEFRAHAEVSGREAVNAVGLLGAQMRKKAN